MIRLAMAWVKARVPVLLYTAAVFCFFITVYAVHGYEWGVAGYAVILSVSLGFALGVWDFISFYRRNRALGFISGKFPTSGLPEPKSLTEENYREIILALEAERKKLQEENIFNRSDAEEYYTLWAHQIKTPIAAAQLLLESKKNGIGTEVKNGLEQELFRINKYVDMVLQYQRLSSMENDMVLKEYELSYLVKQAVKSCAALFIYKGLAPDISNISGKIVTDKKWFCFVIEQLLTNAVKYTPNLNSSPGGDSSGAIRIYGNNPETLTVEDCGVGIPPEDLPRVFERGFTGSQGRAERSSTGIGLYLSRRILGKLGFGIAVESEMGKGTRVILKLNQEKLEIE